MPAWPSPRRTTGSGLLEFEDLVNPRVTQRLFYFRYLLPLWFDVHALEYPPGGEPWHRWSYGPR